MPDVTPLYGLPYPASGDSLRSAVSTTPQQLAQAVESTLSGWAGVPAAGARVVLTSAQLSNSFTTGTTTSYRKIGSTVDLAIQVNRASAWAANTAIFTLPAGFRPSHARFFEASDTSTRYTIQVATTGVVSVLNAGSNGIVGSFMFHL